ncbi:MAG: T9SS type A sorting domain-containing protein [Fluviicola sp.]|nr:T9SS type A sorting domain-containing protein [Fluviicola sp.]
MKKIFTSVALCLAASASMAQIGAVAPDFTATDINGNSHNLYTYLNAGKVVLLDVSATWCGPCWGFHTNQYLEDLYAEYGPAGTNEVVVLFYEGDAATNAQDLDGTDGASQGDWITGTPYPIINESPVQISLNIYAPLGFPTINVICPSDKIIKWDLWDSQAGTPAASLANMRTKVQEVIDDCAMAADVTENSLLEASVAPNPTTGATTIRFNATTAEKATVSVYSVSGALVSTTLYDVVNGANAIEINLSEMEAGTYFVKVNSSEAVSNMIPVVKK